MHNMRKACVLIIPAILALCSAAALAQAPTPGELEMIRLLREIRAILIDLRTDVADLKKKKAKPEPAKDDDLSGLGRFQGRKLDQSKIGKIKLPENPSEDQIREYIQDIVAASHGQNMFSNTDPQVEMLEKVGVRHLKLLIDALGTQDGMSGFGGDYHVQQAILKLAGEEHKELILTSLFRHTFLVKVVLNNGWEKEAKDILVKKLATPQVYLPTEWIQAVANLGDPKTYDDLKWHLIHRDNRYGTFEAIRDLPGLDLEEAVAKAWTKTGYHEWEERGLAKIAVQYGHLTALEYLVNYLTEEHDHDWDASEIRRLVLRHVDFRGSNKEIAAWLKKNADKLIFDKTARKFTVVSGAKTVNPKDASGQQ